MAWLKEVMEGVERLMATSKEDAQIKAYKKVANLLATIAGVEEPYPIEELNNEEVNENDTR